MYILPLITFMLTFLCTFYTSVDTAERNADDTKDTFLLSDRPLNNTNRKFVTIALENDLYASVSDQNYTNGIRISWFDLDNGGEWTSRALGKILPFFPVNDTTMYAYSIGQNLYTPIDIESDTVDLDDRPWAAFLYGSIAVSTLLESKVDEIEITLGIIGPSALGEDVQSIVHEIIDSPMPKGWDNQLHDELGLNVSWQRRWLEVFSAENESFFLGFTPHAGVTLGNIYSYLNVGGIIKICPIADRWNDRPLLVRPGMPGTGYFFPSENFTMDAFVGFDGRFVAHNIFLDGNTFVDSYSVEKIPFVVDLSVGISMSIRACRLSYTLVQRTREFVEQDHSSLFGSIGFTYNY